MGKTTFITLLAGLFLLHAPTTQAQDPKSTAVQTSR